MTYFVIIQYEDKVKPGEHFIVRGKLSHALTPPHAVIMRVSRLYKDGQQVPLEYLQATGKSEMYFNWRRKWKYNTAIKLELFFTEEAPLGRYRLHIECAWVENGVLNRTRDIRTKTQLLEEPEL
ncbi:hypothetical protein LIA77_08908 [Sarocladium implicatum]|nr:hypothetical protein LIA77_08908 [Sarocladium implicatum]